MEGAHCLVESLNVNLLGLASVGNAWQLCDLDLTSERWFQPWEQRNESLWMEVGQSIRLVGFQPAKTEFSKGLRCWNFRLNWTWNFLKTESNQTELKYFVSIQFGLLESKIIKTILTVIIIFTINRAKYMINHYNDVKKIIYIDKYYIKYLR